MAVSRRFRTLLGRAYEYGLSVSHGFLKKEGFVPLDSRYEEGEVVGRMQHNWEMFKRESYHLYSGAWRSQCHDPEFTVFKFDSEEVVSQWYAMGDADMGGYSHSTLSFGPNRKMVWRGNIDTKVPNNKQKMFKSGFAGIRSLPFLSSFDRVGVMDLSSWNILELRVRGDGRRYHLNITIDERFSETELDLYFHPIYTKGGPYWEVIQIPFSHLILTHAGRMKDASSPMSRMDFKSIGFSLVEHFHGPFQLEVDYIKVLTDDSHKQACAYETIAAGHGVEVGSKFAKM